MTPLVVPDVVLSMNTKHFIAHAYCTVNCLDEVETQNDIYLDVCYGCVNVIGLFVNSKVKLCLPHDR